MYVKCTLAMVLLLFANIAAAQQMSMPGMENSVGYFSSGTSLEPKNTGETAPMVHKPIGSWTLLFHANSFLVDIQQSGPRGFDKMFAPNWLMPMIVRQSGRHTLMFRTMFSLEPATVTERRYPLLFQSGETAFGLPVVDGQHPHDLIMEISGRYDFNVSERTQLYVYGGPVAEPALGPPAFPHRASASENPLAVLGHHQEDSTHISNNVVTLGVISGPVQLEASTFRGTEPNENRWNFDGGAPNSFSSRLTVAASGNLVGQFSMGRINNREALEPNLDTLRTTASVIHYKRFSSGYVASSLIWGRNKDMESHERRIFNAYTLESTVNFLTKNWAWTRIENVDRDQTLVTGETHEAVHVGEEPIGRVQAFTFGYGRDLPVPWSSVKLGLGVQASVYGVPPVLKPLYGDRPTGVAFFLRLRPAGNMAQHMRMMHGH